MHNNIYDNNSNIYTMQIKEEQLDINKKLVQTGDFTIYRETYIEEKTLVIPINHIDLVIVPKSFNTNDKLNPIRIPMMEEQIEIYKSPVQLEDVKIYKNEFEDVIPIETTLKRESVNVDNPHSISIINKN